MSDFISTPTFYYNRQLKKYLIQFMAIFGGMQVQVGWNEDKEPRLIKVPIYSASKDRVVAALKGESTQNKPVRLPTMSAHLQNIELAPEMRKGVPMSRRQTYMPTGGVFPDDIHVDERRMPVPYAATYELSVWASNQEQHDQIIEQILMIFNPLIQIQTSDDLHDWTKITQVELTGVQKEENIPAGGDRRIIRTLLTFKIPIWISAPADVHQRYVKDIYVRIGAINYATTNSYDIIAELDAQGLEYELDFTLDDIDIGEDT